MEERLETWKEIAAYLKRDVRTVQRWEKEQGLPVHRHLHHQGATVYAFRPELDTWWAAGTGLTPAKGRSQWPGFFLASAIVLAAMFVGILELNWGEDTRAATFAGAAAEVTAAPVDRYVHVVESANQTGESVFDGSFEQALQHTVQRHLPVLWMPRNQFDNWFSAGLGQADSKFQEPPPFLVLEARLLADSGGGESGETGPYTLQVDIIRPATASIVATLREQVSGRSQVLPAALRISEELGGFLEAILSEDSPRFQQP